MTNPLRIAVLSAWHVHAEEYGRAAQDSPDCELVAVWDDDAERGRALAEKLGVRFEADLDAVLAEVDGVTVTTATSHHDDVIGAALVSGVHVFTEKLLSPTLDGCDRLIASAREHDARLMVSLPRLTHAYTSALREILDSGELGRITYVRVRLAHDGAVADWLPERFYDSAAAIGGAFSDLGAHPVYLTQLVLGPELTVVGAAYTDMTGRGVEDNAVVTVTNPDGAIGVIETGFVTPCSPFSIEVQGTAGSVQFGLGPDDRTFLLDTGDGPHAVDLPEDSATPFERWVADIRGRTTTDAVGSGPEFQARSRDLTRLVVDANAAAHR